ncbi:MAG: prepilin-type N-terminal cleavage/methylation domain-containing protein [Bacillota bacterium]|nr:prepilin-type N-terminal cleavage/methylation domain-containing protein [Bacillota bacterium]
MKARRVVKKKGNKGFTLVEVIVVLVILAILAAILIPSMIGWIKKAQDSSLITECRTVVLAAQTTAVELYTDGTLSDEGLYGRRDEIIELAEVDGTIVEITCDVESATITRLLYKAANGKYVLYENGKYTVSDDGTAGNSASGYLKTSLSLLSDAQKIQNNKHLWENLLDAFKTAYGGAYPSLSDTEKEILNGVSDRDALVWKPTLLKQGDGQYSLMMIAAKDEAASKNNAYMIYYNGSYYYHTNGKNQNSKYVDDRGRFDLSTLEIPVKNDDYWVKVE